MTDPLHCPAPVRHQLALLVDGFRQTLGENLIGIYLHGSLAMGCFNPGLSDIDLLIRVQEPLDRSTRHRIVSLLLDLSGNPFPVELSILSDADLFPWRYPTPYTFHFGEDWRARYQAEPGWAPAEKNPVDPDLAAHITVLHARGVTLLGPPVADAFPIVPTEHYRDSILRDYQWALDRLHQNPVYAVLNMTRVLRYLTDGTVVSKQEAGEWALDVLPSDVRPVLSAALAYYRGERDAFHIEVEALERFVSVVGERVETR